MVQMQQFYLKKLTNLNSTHYISHLCKINTSAIWVDNQLVMEAPENLFPDFAKLAYQKFEIKYPKFFKMDKLSKLAFLSAELILRKTIKDEMNKNIALVFANQSASLDTDVNYQKTIDDRNDYFPSPAVFVYTLPNICVGEICIKHQLQSENIFFVTEKFNSELMFNYAESILNQGKADRVLCSWVELYNEDYQSFVYLVDKEGQIEHSIENLNKL